MERIFQRLIEGNAGLAISETETYLAAWPNPQTSEKLREVKAEYELMVSYWQKGVRDPELENQYMRLLQRVYVLCANISIHRHISSSSYLNALSAATRKQGSRWSIDAILKEMEDFVSNVAMLELEPEHLRQEKSKELYSQHQQQMNALFNYVLTSRIWTEGVGRNMEELLVSPTVDCNDQQLLVSAVMLSLMNRFDMVKFRLLVNVYSRSQDEHVRQRALVGWVLSIDDDFINVYPEQRDMINELLASKRVCRELTELQMQLVYTLNAEKDTTMLRDEIMPDLMKNNAFRITQNGIEEVAEDPMEDILNPGASEERMEKLESTFQRMMDMQKQGADIYFGGFSQMKRYPFFYDMSNWLVPFYIQHPDISQFVQRIGSNRMIETILGRASFSNSDKYSFIIAFQQVMNQLPENIRLMMKRGEASMGDEVPTEELQSPAFIRRSYLMDLYRFFRLFPNRAALCNPFDTSKSELGMCLFFGSALFHETPLERRKGEVVAMLMKRRLKASATELLGTFAEEVRDVQYYLWMGDYEEALRLEPDNERALAGQARSLFNAEHYDEALTCYDRLQLLRPEKTGYVLNKAVCLVRLEAYDDALKLLFQLNYEHEDDDNVLRVLAWTLACCGKLEQAAPMYEQLTSREQPSDGDFRNQGHCQWLMGHISEAADSFKKYYEMSGISPESPSFFDKDWLEQRGITAIDIKMMSAML